MSLTFTMPMKRRPAPRVHKRGNYKGRGAYTDGSFMRTVGSIFGLPKHIWDSRFQSKYRNAINKTLDPYTGDFLTLGGAAIGTTIGYPMSGATAGSILANAQGTPAHFSPQQATKAWDDLNYLRRGNPDFIPIDPIDEGPPYEPPIDPIDEGVTHRRAIIVPSSLPPLENLSGRGGYKWTSNNPLPNKFRK